MSTIDILYKLPLLFRSADLPKFTGNANVFLTRALQRGMITRLTHGVYLNTRMKGEPSIEEAACFVRTPSYISAEWALHLHGIILQAPSVCTVITLSTAVGVALNWSGAASRSNIPLSVIGSSSGLNPGRDTILPCRKRRCSTASIIATPRRLRMNWNWRSLMPGAFRNLRNRFQ
ncbi:MAG: hypothetical protein Q7U40_11520 [Desulfatirhabdiaceae bacterium]|nr:hypothetical protein [Desulfatirhabdiaceae bacterium]